MQLDNWTIATIVAVVGIVSTSVMTVTWRINPSEKGTGCWALAAAFGTFSFLVLWLVPFVSNYAVFLNNAFILTASIAMIEGILRFRGFGNESSRIKYIPLFIFIAFFISFLIRNDPAVRYQVLDPLLVLSLVVPAFLLVYRTYKLERILNSMIAATFLTLSAGFMYRWYLAFTGEIDSGFLSHPFIGVLFLLVILWVLGWTYGFIMAINLRSQKKIMRMASHDDLTGLANRRNLNEHVAILIEESSVDNKGVIVFLFDVNGFKRINDTYGHKLGDEILVAIADSINKSVRDTDLSVRYGGDEFVVVISSKAGGGDAGYFTERLRNAVEHPREVCGFKMNLKISIGFAVFPEDGSDIDELINVADKRMYIEKAERYVVSEVID